MSLLKQISFYGPCLTHYQKTNFRLFQTERVCRRQFQIRGKWQKIIQTGRKHCGKRRNSLLRAISSFPTVFSKGLLPRAVKRFHCVGMGKLFLKQALVFTCLWYKSFESTLGKEKLLIMSNFLLFPQCFLTIWKTFYDSYQFEIVLWKRLQFVVWERVKLLLYLPKLCFCGCI